MSKYTVKFWTPEQNKEYKIFFLPTNPIKFYRYYTAQTSIADNPIASVSHIVARKGMTPEQEDEQDRGIVAHRCVIPDSIEEVKHKCNCVMETLMRTGCKCGGI